MLCMDGTSARGRDAQGTGTSHHVSWPLQRLSPRLWGGCPGGPSNCADWSADVAPHCDGAWAPLRPRDPQARGLIPDECGFALLILVALQYIAQRRKIP